MGVGAAGSAGVRVAVVDVPTSAASGLVAITVPNGTATGGSGVVVGLPAELSATTGGAVASVTLPDGRPLPAWIRHDPRDNTLVLGAVPDGAFPLQLVLMAGGQRSVLQISEDAAR